MNFIFYLCGSCVSCAFGVCVYYVFYVYKGQVPEIKLMMINIHFFSEAVQVTYNQTQEFCISQGTVATFFRCGSKSHNFFQDSLYKKLFRSANF